MGLLRSYRVSSRLWLGERSPLTAVGKGVQLHEHCLSAENGWSHRPDLGEIILQTINPGRFIVNQEPSAMAELAEDRVVRISPGNLLVLGGYVVGLVNDGGMHLSSMESDGQEQLDRENRTVRGVSQSINVDLAELCWPIPSEICVSHLRTSSLIDSCAHLEPPSYRILKVL